ncbi:MAG: hypothetical protein KDI01_12110, partial [Halioglobus sp.]|nr:hypothetical protein [Halioglobus sp.]
MVNKLGYDGTPEFYRDRKLTEADVLRPEKEDLLPDTELIDRQAATEQLFDDLSVNYIKGEVLKKGLAKMEPAAFIPIDQSAEPVVAAARRQFQDLSKKGTIITYSMYQNCIDGLMDERWEFRNNYLQVTPVNSSYSSIDRSESRQGSGIEDETKNLIKEFLAENGIAGTIMAVFVASPFQSLIFQSLSPEEAGARSAHLSFAIAGIAFLIELGIKAERIYAFLKKQKLNFALTEEQVVGLEDPTARAAALSEFGIDYSDLIIDMKVTDYQILSDYVSDYYKLHSGMLQDNSNFTLDHWLAYKQVAYNQQSIRGALNIADKYSDKYRDLKGSTLEPVITGPISASATSSNTDIHIDLASTLRSLNGRTDVLYDDIVRSFNHYLTDGELCCLVSLFGTQSPELLRTISTILRILAVSLGGEFIRLDNILRRWIANKLQAAAYEILEQLNTFYHKIDAKLTQAFTIDIDGLPYCSALLS